MKTYLDLAEIEELEESATCMRDKLLIRILVRTGCRISELLALKVQDIDFKNETVTIAHLKTKLNLSCPECSVRLARSHKFCPGCGISVEKPVAKALEKERRRVIPIDRESLELLEDFIIKDRTKDLIFQVTPTRAFQVVKECAEKAGLPKLVHPESGKEHHVSPHKLRDAFAVHAVQVDDSGDGLRMLQYHLGHQNINTTMRYRKLSGAEHKEWYDKILEQVHSKTGTNKLNGAE